MGTTAQVPGARDVRAEVLLYLAYEWRSLKSLWHQSLNVSTILEVALRKQFHETHF